MMDASSTYIYGVTEHMYRALMKAITITIPEKLDARAAAEAKRRGISKSELIRRGLASVLPEPQESESRDLWNELAGFASDVDPIEPGEIDRIVYDR
jgi:ribbon-helix-helix CopG family protein